MTSFPEQVVAITERAQSFCQAVPTCVADLPPTQRTLLMMNPYSYSETMLFGLALL